MGDTGRGEQWARRVSPGSLCLSCSHVEARYRAFVTDGLALGQRGPSNRSLSGRRDPSGTAQLSSEWGVAARSRLVVFICNCPEMRFRQLRGSVRLCSCVADCSHSRIKGRRSYPQSISKTLFCHHPTPAFDLFLGQPPPQLPHAGAS